MIDYILAEIGDTLETEMVILLPLPPHSTPSFSLFLSNTSVISATLLSDRMSKTAHRKQRLNDYSTITMTVFHVKS
jgi:hypothetical protein